MSNNSSHTLECVARITDFSGRNILVEVRFRSRSTLLLKLLRMTLNRLTRHHLLEISVQKCTQAAVSIPLHTPQQNMDTSSGLH